jgi:hypothetical protein
MMIQAGGSVLLAIRADWRIPTNLMQAMLVPSLPDAQQPSALHNIHALIFRMPSFTTYSDGRMA